MFLKGMTDDEWLAVPEHMRQGLIDFVHHGIPGGGFLEAVLCNDLRLAAGRADSINMYRIKELVLFLNYNIPSQCWGSREAYLNWIELGGLDKILRMREDKDADNMDEPQGA